MHFFSSENVEADDEDDETEEIGSNDNMPWEIVEENSENMDKFYAEEDDADKTEELQEAEQVSDCSSGFAFNRHSTCAAHKLQLVLKDVFEKNQRMIELRKVCLVFERVQKYMRIPLNQACFIRLHSTCPNSNILSYVSCFSACFALSGSFQNRTRPHICCMRNVV